MGKPINWNQVYYFAEVAHCGSLKEASEQLNLSSSTLSEHVAQLEKELGLQLFQREHRKLVLTPEGTKLFLRAREMFEVGERLLGDLSRVPLSQYPISIGLVPTPSIRVAYHLIGDFLKAYGPLDMKLFHAKYGELEEAISSAKFDLGFSDRVPERKDIGFEKISSSPIRFYVAPSVDDLSFSDLLEKLPLLVCNAEPKTRTIVEQGLEKADVKVRRIVTADYPGVLSELCMRGLGVGAFGQELLTAEKTAFRTLRAPRDAPKVVDDLYLYWSLSGENREPVRKLFELLRQKRKG